MRGRARRAWCVAWCAVACVACGTLPDNAGENTDEIEAGARDTGRPAPRDAGVDARDTGVDAASDARADAFTAIDARGDVPIDARADAFTDPPADARNDVVPDARGDAGLGDAGGDAAIPSDSGATPDAGTDAGTTEPGGAWETLGFGVSYRDTGLATGRAVMIVYGGYTATIEASQAWALELWRDDMSARGVRHVYAVQGPREAAYSSREIQNSRLAPHLVARTTRETPFIAVMAHSSGSFPAHELFDQLFNRGYDPSRLTDDRVVYYNLDGGGLYLTAAIVTRLRAAYFTFASDPAINTRSNNAAAAESMARMYSAQGGRPLGITTRDTGCNRGATWCMHDAVVTTRPHNPAHYDLARDYTLFDEGRRVQTAYLTQTEASLR